jgi:hypothetical protein
LWLRGVIDVWWIRYRENNRGVDVVTWRSLCSIIRTTSGARAMNDYESDPEPPALGLEHLEQLRLLVAKMQHHECPWGDWRGGNKLSPGVYSMPWMDIGDLASDAMTWLYDSNRVFWFDWPEWDEGRRIFECWHDDTAASLDHLTVRKLITAIARNDRFCEGAWAEFFEEGQGPQLFARLLELEERLAAGESGEEVRSAKG